MYGLAETAALGHYRFAAEGRVVFFFQDVAEAGGAVVEKEIVAVILVFFLDVVVEKIQNRSFFGSCQVQHLFGHAPVGILVKGFESPVTVFVVEVLGGYIVEEFSPGEFYIEIGIVEIESAVVVYDVGDRVAVYHPESAVAEGGIQFIAGRTGKQRDAQAGAVLGGD